MGWAQLEALLTVSGNPSSLGITTASAGGVPNTVTDTSTTYSFTSSSDASRIVGAVNSNLPGNTSLTIMLAAPAGASSAGGVVLSTTNQDLVTNIPIASGSNLNITYQFSATCAAGVISPITRTVTLTLLP